VLSVLLRFTDSDYAFVIFKLFLHSIRKVPRTHLCLLLRASSVFNSSSTTVRYSFGLYLDGRKCVVVSYQVVSAESKTERKYISKSADGLSKIFVEIPQINITLFENNVHRRVKGGIYSYLRDHFLNHIFT